MSLSTIISDWESYLQGQTLGAAAPTSTPSGFNHVSSYVLAAKPFFSQSIFIYKNLFKEKVLSKDSSTPEKVRALSGLASALLYINSSIFELGKMATKDAYLILSKARITQFSNQASLSEFRALPFYFLWALSNYIHESAEYKRTFTEGVKSQIFSQEELKSLLPERLGGIAAKKVNVENLDLHTLAYRRQAFYKKSSARVDLIYAIACIYLTIQFKYYKIPDTTLTAPILIGRSSMAIMLISKCAIYQSQMRYLPVPEKSKSSEI